MIDLGQWLDQQTSRAPAALRERVQEYARSASGSSLVASLAAAGHRALERVLSHSGDRSAALDLLAADALITLALLAQAESAPDQLEEFAISVLRTARPDA
ncbi:MAG TPA: hypothetical protein VFS51_06460 [Gemmatimonadales bacterium]|nr:hypothetical protein [Gemmatimonadales bacterium]